MPPDPRPSWDAYFLGLAALVSTRATCPRKAVGAVVVRARRVLVTGYNGAVPGAPHCVDVGCDLVPLADGTVNCVRTVHAEANAVCQAAATGVALAGGTLYGNTYPCWACAKLIASVGLVRVVVGDGYRKDARVEDAFRAAGIELVGGG